jgi:hypothetical protein
MQLGVPVVVSTTQRSPVAQHNLGAADDGHGVVPEAQMQRWIDVSHIEPDGQPGQLPPQPSSAHAGRPEHEDVQTVKHAPPRHICPGAQHGPVALPHGGFPVASHTHRPFEQLCPAPGQVPMHAPPQPSLPQPPLDVGVEQRLFVQRLLVVHVVVATYARQPSLLSMQVSTVLPLQRCVPVVVQTFVHARQSPVAESQPNSQRVELCSS